MIRADDQAHDVRHDDADERNRTAERDGRAGEQRRADERDALRFSNVDAARFGRRLAEADEIEHARQRGNRGKRRRHRDERDDDVGVAADVERSHHPPHAPEHVRVVSDHLDETVQRSEKRAERDAREQQHGARRAAAPCDRHQVYDAQRARRSGEACHRQRRHTEQRRVEVKRDHDDGAESRAARDAERVRRCQRIAQQCLKDHAGDGEASADEHRRQDARKARDEEHLRVDVVRERNRAVERARQADGRCPDERRQRADEDGQRAEARDRPDDPPPQISRRGQAAPP